MDFSQTDLMSLDTHTFEPEPFYTWLRDNQPLYQDPNNGLWAVSRYEDVVFISMNTDIFCSGMGVVPLIPVGVWPDEAMINLDGQDHTIQRALVSKGFTPRRIAGMEGSIRQIAADLIDKVEEAGACDLVKDLATPLPMRVIGEMLGYPPEIDEEVLGWADIFTMGGCGPDHITEDVLEAFDYFCEFHENLVEERTENPGDDLLSIWLTAEIDGQRLSEEKILWEHNLLLVGGSETTRNAIALGMMELLKHPDQWAWLREHPESIGGAVEEIIRWATPFVRMARTLTRDHEMHGRTMKEGDQVVMLYPAANRDPRVFDKPQVFDIRREFPKPALSFGIGKHYCMGAALARMEVRVLLEEILRRLPNLALAGEAHRHRSCFTRGLTSLPVTF